MKTTLLLLTALSMALSMTADAARKITVFPKKNSQNFRCQVGPEKLPVTLEEGMLHLKVGVVGAKGSIYWRVPFKQYHDGENQVSLAQAGNQRPVDGVFTIALDPTKLPYESETQRVQVKLIAANGAEATCTTQLSIVDPSNNRTASYSPSSFVDEASIQ